ncbi:MAG TPA: squalene/phytoene synthase family protein [Gammaproteobacteria bacterium]|nr:squalene/phytoene synthase family protein [Gammaproteobacteria bacterium]
MHATSTPGSSLYYSVMHADSSVRENIILYRNIYEKLKTIKPVAISWWEQELQTKPELLPILQAFVQDSQTNLYENDLSLHQFYKNTAGAFEKALGKFYGITDTATLDILENLGIFIAKVDHLRNCKKRITQGKSYFSGEQLLKHQLNLYELSKLELTPNIHTLFEDEAQHAFSYFIPVKNKKIRPTLILAHIQKALLTEMKQSHFPVFTHQISLTPLRKWWIAIRH